MHSSMFYREQFARPYYDNIICGVWSKDFHQKIHFKTNPIKLALVASRHTENTATLSATSKLSTTTKRHATTTHVDRPRGLEITN